MKKKFILLVAFLLLAGTICFVFVTQSKNTKQDRKQETPVSTTSEKHISNTQGYSLYLTKNYIFAQTSPGETEFVHSSSNPDKGITWIDTEPANGRTFEEVVDAVILDQGGITNIITTAVKIDGEPAIVVEPLSGQNLIRRLIVVHNGILYQMNFTPDDPQVGEPYEQMEDFYKTVVDTFRFTK